MRLLPWLQLAARDEPHNVSHLTDCEGCMARYSTAARQEMGCGFEQPIDRALAWRHRGYRGPEPTICPGYTTRLPEVGEVASAYLHWSNGASAAVHGRLEPHTADLILVFNGEVNAVDGWRIENPKAKG